MLHLLLLTTALATAAPASHPRMMPALALPTDSVGRAVQGGKTYIKHKVAKGDSFYAIARKYRVPMDQIVAANPKVQGTLSIGQIVLVPRSVAVLTAEPKAAEKVVKAEKAEKKAEAAAVGTGSGEAVTKAGAGRMHTVASGQTLSAIARQYRVSVADLRRWNHLKNDNLRLKQQLVVSAPAASVAVAEAKPSAEEKVVTAPKDEVAKVEVRKEEARKEEAKAEANPDAPRRATEAADDTTGGMEVAESLRKVTESGMAEIIESSGESSKFLALHRSAAVGSLLQVKNPQNGQSVYVRVIGKLPPTGANENVIIRLSKRAVQKLQVVDQRFRVEVSYMP